MAMKMNVPKLRFPEFEGEWEERKIESSIDLLTGYPFKGEEISDEKGGIPLLRGINITEGRIRHSQEIDRYYHGELKGLEKFLSNSGDLVLGMDGSKVGKNSAILDKKNSGTLLVQRVARIRAKSNSSLNFIFHHINSIKFHDYVAKVNTSSGIPHISPKQIKDFKIYFPPLPEQQKIATFLTTIDTRIQQLSRKKALLEQYKKGVMQQIFSQEIRFKDEEGKEFPAWEEKKLEALTYKVGIKNKHGANLPIYSINNKEGFLPQSDQFDGIDSNERGYDITLYKVINANTFAYNPARINVGSIGFSGNLNEVIISSLYVCFKTKEVLDDQFLLSYLKTYEFNKAVLRNSEGGVRSYLFYENFSKIKIPLPYLYEQQKIAAFLSTIDRQINLVSQQLERMQTFKKGLLQQMFV